MVDDVARGVARGRTGFVSSWVGGRAGADSEVHGWLHGSFMVSAVRLAPDRKA